MSGQKFSREQWNPEMLRSLGRLDYIAQSVIDGALSGRHKSVRRGFSSEFFDYKIYQDGDDAAKIDWRLYAKTSKFFLKRFEAETSLEVMILNDVSPSMRWNWRGAPSKAEYAVWLGASLAWLFSRQRDLVGFHTFGDMYLRHLAPKASPGSAERIFSLMEAKNETLLKNPPETLTECARAVSRILPHKGLLVLISDLEVPSQELREALALLRAKDDELVVFHLLDHYEIELPFDRLTHLRDSDTGELLPFSPAEAKRGHAARVASFRSEVRDLVRSNGGVYLSPDTNTPPAEAILDMMRGREDKRR